MSQVNLEAQNKTVQVGSLFENMPVTGMHWKVGLVLFFSFVIEAWEMMIIILCAGSISTDLKLDGTQIGSLISAIFLGMMFGSLIWGKITDKIGRKKTMEISLIFYGDRKSVV